MLMIQYNESNLQANQYVGQCGRAAVLTFWHKNSQAQAAVIVLCSLHHKHSSLFFRISTHMTLQASQFVIKSFECMNLVYLVTLHSVLLNFNLIIWKDIWWSILKGLIWRLRSNSSWPAWELGNCQGRPAMLECGAVWWSGQLTGLPLVSDADKRSLQPSRSGERGVLGKQSRRAEQGISYICFHLLKTCIWSSL